MVCGRCGREARPGDVFCRQCGARLEEGPAAGPEETGAEAALPHPPPPRPPAPPPAYRAAPGGTSGWAVASLVLGILSFIFLPVIGAVLALVFGILGRSGIKRSGGEVGGSGMATAGIVLGGINLAFFVLAAAVFVPWAYFNVGKTRTVSRTVSLQGAESVKAELDMREGDMRVEGGAGSLFEGDFTFNVERWEPDIDYSIDEGLGELRVRQGGSSWVPTLWNARNDWDIAFSDDVPLELEAELSSGEGRFELSTLSLSSLAIDSSSGDVYCGLSGDMDDLKRVGIFQSSGDVTLDMKGVYDSYIKLDLGNSSGDIALDLSGDWADALLADIECSSGDVKLVLPEEVGVRVRARTSSGDVDAGGMKAGEGDGGEGTVYVNESFGESIVTLQINVTVSSGDIELRLE